MTDEELLDAIEDRLATLLAPILEKLEELEERLLNISLERDYHDED